MRELFDKYSRKVDVFGTQCSFLTTTMSEICAQSEKHRLRQISAYNVSTLRDGERCSITTNRNRPRAFQRAIDGMRTLPPSHSKGGSKSEFLGRPT